MINFKLINKRKIVGRVYINHIGIFYDFKNSVRGVNSDFEDFLCIEDIERTPILETINDSFIIYRSINKNIFNCISQSNVILINGILFKNLWRILDLKNDKVLVRRKNDEDSYSICLYDLDANLILEYKERNGVRNAKFIAKNHLIFFDEYEIKLTSINSEKKNWQFDFTEHSEWNDPINGLIDGTVGEIFYVSEVFFIVLSHRWKLTAFQITDGVILWEHSFDNTLPLIYNYFQNSFHLFSDMYYSIDANTGQVLEQHDFRTIFNENELRTYWLTNPAVNDTFIAVTSHLDNSIIIINRKDFSIAQIIKLDKSKLGVPLPNKPVFLENKLLQLDGENNLYVFSTI